MSDIYSYKDQGVKRAKKVEKKFKVKLGAVTMRTRRGKSGNVDKTNQDSFISHPNLNGSDDMHLFGVFDGHGNKIMKKIMKMKLFVFSLFFNFLHFFGIFLFF